MNPNPSTEPTGVPRYYVLYRVRGGEVLRAGPYNTGKDLTYQLGDIAGFEGVEIVGTEQEFRCAGLFEVCDTPPDHRYTIDDPAQKDSAKVFLCEVHALASQELFRLIEETGKTEEFRESVDRAMREHEEERN